ncbi:hypothetical protein ACI8B_30062 [Acinetobacter proteolyticus]|uniref:Uncharacterized protein n=1 Tax=Acinetobacter proteolyticus TaxID=1776741 RepID=A0A653K823_9GAMM|nr:hypothetical protein ACI8B_30062 [Acinetobacter proteolyticus]
MFYVLPHLSLSSRGLGHRPFTAVTGVRIPVGTPYSYLIIIFFSQSFSIRLHIFEFSIK